MYVIARDSWGIRCFHLINFCLCVVKFQLSYSYGIRMVIILLQRIQKRQGAVVIFDGPYVVLVPATQTTYLVENLRNGLTYSFTVRIHLAMFSNV